MEKVKVLLVDDEIDFIELMGARIKGWGYDVLGASNGKEAIETVANQKPDIVILDYMMPDMDGVEVLKKIREINNQLPVIMFTAYPNPEAMKGSEKSGVTAFIPKLSVYADTQSALRAAIEIWSKKMEGKKE